MLSLSLSRERRGGPAQSDGRVRGAMTAADRFLGFAIAPLTRRRIEAFKANRRGVWSLVLLLALFGRQRPANPRLV